MYDAVCSTHGEHEVRARISDVFARGDDALACATCGGPVKQIIKSVQRSRIDDSENVGAERSDGTKGMMLGFPGVETVVGRRENGKDATEYRPVFASEMPTRRSQLEYAKRHGLSPADNGRFRTSA